MYKQLAKNEKLAIIISSGYKYYPIPANPLQAD